MDFWSRLTSNVGKAWGSAGQAWNNGNIIGAIGDVVLGVPGAALNSTVDMNAIHADPALSKISAGLDGARVGGGGTFGSGGFP